jgi:cardiolipin synthase (CMP-forming)
MDETGEMHDQRDRVLTVPNVISFVRLCCIPWFLWLLFAQDDRHSAAWLLAVLGCTDWIDGYIARRWHQVSTVGKILDPTADRLMLAVGVVAIVVDGSVPLVIGILTIAREVTVGIAVLILAAMGARRIDVTWAGKAGTFGQMVAYPLFLVSNAGVNWSDIAEVLAWIVILPALLLAYRSAAGYVPLARKALADGRVGSRS